MSSPRLMAPKKFFMPLTISSHRQKNTPKGQNLIKSVTFNISSRTFSSEISTPPRPKMYVVVVRVEPTGVAC